MNTVLTIIVSVVILAVNITCGYLPGCSLKKKDFYMPEYKIFRQGAKKVFMPKVFAPEAPVEKIFAVPVKNAVGTIDIVNGITVIRFAEDKLEYDVVAKNYLKEVNGGFDYAFCNVFSDEEIAYTQNRWFVIANFKNGRVISPVITYSLDDYVTGIKGIDFGKRKFLIQRETPDYDDYEKILHVLNVIDKDSIQDEGSIKASPGKTGYSAPWQFSNGFIFTYDDTTNKISCHDTDLKPSTHPFAEIFNRQSETFRKLKEFLIHPTLPFGIVLEIGKDFDFVTFNKLPKTEDTQRIKDSLWQLEDIHALYLLRWDTPDTQKQFVPILTDSFSLVPPLDCSFYGGLQFSPDGSWMVFRDESRNRKNPVFTSLPIDSTAPNFFGEPLYLGRIMAEYAEPVMSAWTSNPLGFVVSTGEQGLWKWDLGRVRMARVIDTAGVVIPTE